MWFDKDNPLVEFCDKRYKDDILLCNGQHIHIQPDTICDFKDLPFPDETFYLAVFDPPHLIDKSEKAWMVKKYGSLPTDWRSELNGGFRECMRVLKENGVLVFKWNEAEIPTREIIKALGQEPLFGHRSGKRSGTNWLVFMKQRKEQESECRL